MLVLTSSSIVGDSQPLPGSWSIEYRMSPTHADRSGLRLSRTPVSSNTSTLPSAPPKTLRCAVVGVGRMGRHHAKKYSTLPGSKLVAVVDGDLDRRESVADQCGCQALDTVEQLLDLSIDAVSIAVPTVHHLQCAVPLLEAGIACLIEKPLATDAVEAEKLMEAAKSSGATLMVGHIERFNPAVRALQRAQETGLGAIVPRFIEVHRVSPMTFRSVDVSVVMDMMIHDLDVVLWLMGGVEPTEIHASGVSVLTDHEDVCNARLVFDCPQGRCVANVTASRLALKTERKTRIIGENAYVSIDYAAKAGMLIRRTANAMQMEEIRQALREGTDLSSLNYHNLVAMEPLQIDDADQLEMELRSFLDAVRTGGTPPIDAEAGFAAVRTAERIIAECRKHGIRG